MDIIVFRHTILFTFDCFFFSFHVFEFVVHINCVVGGVQVNSEGKMHFRQNYIAIASFLLVVLHNCESSRYSHLTIVDRTLNDFFRKEEGFWDNIQASTNSQAINTTLTELLDYFDLNLKLFNVGGVDAVRMINDQLAAYIDEIKRTQYSETRWLEEKRYDDIQRHCEIITSTIPNGINQIFDITKSPTFMTYLRDNSDFCQTNKRIVTPGVENLQLQNVVTDFYSTVVGTLVKGYMTAQMAYMVQRAKGTC